MTRYAIAGILVCLSAAIFGCNPAQEENLVQIKGSDTMLPLVSAWAEAYMEANPEMIVTVSGGGSGVGIAALLSETTDICMASRDLRKEEIEKAEEVGFTPDELDMALDGIAIAINPNNPIDTLTLEQLKLIFTGQYENWSELGGPDMSILILSRESSSGTYAFFSEAVMDSEDYANRARLMPATSAIVESVAEDEVAIGYIGLGFAEARADDVKIVPVKTSPDAEPVEPSLETVRNESYPIARALHFYTPAERREAVQAFIDFCLSEAGQEIVIEVGYVPVS